MSLAPNLADELRELEVSLLQPETRHSRTELQRLLSKEFREFGGSGAVFSRAVLIELLLKEAGQPFKPTHVSDFTALELAPGVALATYQSTRDGQVRLRSSIWRREGAHWRMVFHQATPAADKGSKNA